MTSSGCATWASACLADGVVRDGRGGTAEMPERDAPAAEKRFGGRGVVQIQYFLASCCPGACLKWLTRPGSHSRVDGLAVCHRVMTAINVPITPQQLLSPSQRAHPARADVTALSGQAAVMFDIIVDASDICRLNKLQQHLLEIRIQ